MNPAELLANVVVDELIRCGVRHVVLSPGSRSAPLAYAVEQAERQSRLQLHIRVDERSAAFLALGLAKVTRVPAAIIMTSGTAVANLHPAVLEADHAGVPLIVVSADRPAALRGTGANQTTTQPGMFGGSVRYEFDLPAPAGQVSEMPLWRSTVCRGYAAATGSLSALAGPAHLNIGLADPLSPAQPGVKLPSDFAGRPESKPWVAVPPSAALAPSGTQNPQGESRTLLVVGDLPDAADFARVVSHAAQAGWPIIAEPFGAGARGEVLPHGSLLLANESLLEAHPPSRVVTVGRLTLSRDIATLTRRSDIRVEHVSATDTWADPGHVVERVTALNSWLAVEPAPVDGAWAQAWRSAGDRLARRLADSTALPGDESPTGVDIAGATRDAVPEGGILVVGSSNAARDLDYARAPHTEAVSVIGNRGLAGIDGTTSTAVGIALSTKAPTTLLVGDLTFLHDINGLLIGPAETRPDLTIVVLNDDGGGIFGTLEYGAVRNDSFQRLFATPTGANLSALCAGYGARHQIVDTVADLASTLAQEAAGIRVIEIAVDPAHHRQRRADLRTAAQLG
ncbi:2-succinyl-5-enolpyruvyl-6-hydroxy-3-cyclohexene-1-carboxylic-acid synthase [Ornithinimicrobium sp. Arc0846-15]|nr:2-succinyl-5-enolpyruvyl-6-hydroxy-3-cyclohexene-1-carboxylic-acid synthase [Ornithinimicrobium laminariae]